MNDNTHFIIPKSNIKQEKITQNGGGKTYVRENYSEHGK